ncbi:hypothetical protein PMAYCL1PPCAC_08964, partial [Pristionchus mayeri]
GSRPDMGDNWTNEHAKRQHVKLEDRLNAIRIKAAEHPNARRVKEAELMSLMGAVCKTQATTDGDKALEDSVKALSDAANSTHGPMAALVKLYLATHENLLRQKAGLPPVMTPHPSTSTTRYPTRSATREANVLDWLKNGGTPAKKQKTVDDDEIQILDTPPPTNEQQDTTMNDAFPEAPHDAHSAQDVSNHDDGAPSEVSNQGSTSKAALQDSGIADMDVSRDTVATEASVADNGVEKAPETANKDSQDNNQAKTETMFSPKKEPVVIKRPRGRPRKIYEQPKPKPAGEDKKVAETIDVTLNVKKEPAEIVRVIAPVTPAKAQSASEKDEVINLSSDDEDDAFLQRAIAELSGRAAGSAEGAELPGTSGLQGNSVGTSEAAAAVEVQDDDDVMEVDAEGGAPAASTSIEKQADTTRDTAVTTPTAFRNPSEVVRVFARRTGPVVAVEKPKTSVNNDQIILVSDDEDDEDEQPGPSHAYVAPAAPASDDQTPVEVIDDNVVLEEATSAANTGVQGDNDANEGRAAEARGDVTPQRPKKRKVRSSLLDLDMNGVRLEDEPGNEDNPRRTRLSRSNFTASPEKKKINKDEIKGVKRFDEIPETPKSRKSQKAFFDEMVKEMQQNGETFETVETPGRARMRGPREMFLQQEKTRVERNSQKEREIDETIKKMEAPRARVGESIPVHQGRGWNYGPDEGKWSCGGKDCSKIFRTHSEVYAHMLNEHMDGQVRGKCLECGDFEHFSQLIVHRKNGDKDTCGREDAAIAYWVTDAKRSAEVEASIEDKERESDMISEMEAILRKCMFRGCAHQISNRPFESFEKLREHYTTEHNCILYYTCSSEDCGRVFTNPAGFLRHRRIECPNVIPLISKKFIDKQKASDRQRIQAEIHREVPNEPMDDHEKSQVNRPPANEPDDIIILD